MTCLLPFECMSESISESKFVVSAHSVRAVGQGKENYDTWNVKTKFLMIRNRTWKYANGILTKPTVITGDAPEAVAPQQAVTVLDEADLKTRTDLVLLICLSEI